VRADLQQAHRTIEWHQGNMTKRLLNPAKNTALIDAIARGDLPYTPKWHRGKWQFAPAVSIDAGRDSNAKVAERNAGLRSKDSIFAEDGEDAQEQEAIIREEVRRTLKTAKELAEELDFDDDVVLTMLETHTQNGFLFKTPDLPEQDDNGKKTPDKPLGKGEVEDEMKSEMKRLLADLRAVSAPQPIVIQTAPQLTPDEKMARLGKSEATVTRMNSAEFFEQERKRTIRLKELHASVPARREAKARAESAVEWAKQFYNAAK
jgi:hypothetical protein